MERAKNRGSQKFKKRNFKAGPNGSQEETGVKVTKTLTKKGTENFTKKKPVSCLSSSSKLSSASPKKARVTTGKTASSVVGSSGSGESKQTNEMPCNSSLEKKKRHRRNRKAGAHHSFRSKLWKPYDQLT